MAHWTDRLAVMDACPNAVEWARTQPDLATAWVKCKRADWMLWLAGKCAGPPGDEHRKPLVLTACECAERALPLIRDEHTQAVAMSAIQTAQAWAHGEATIEEVRTVAAVTYTAADADAAAAAVAVAVAVAVATNVAAAAADATYGVTYATYDVTYATYAAAKALREMAVIVRRHYPEPPVLHLLSRAEAAAELARQMARAC